VGNRKAPDEVSHLWVLAKMLTTLKNEPAPSLLSRFMKYVIAASHPKIRRRSETPSSKEYWQCFTSVEPESRLDAAQAYSKRKILQIELENDRNFLIILGKGKIVPDYEVQFPNIANVLKELPNPKGKTSPDVIAHSTTTFELFNATTCKEYHHLFTNLMGQYRTLVDNIATLVKEVKSFEVILDDAVKTGHALLTMVKGRAFYLYLSANASKLSKCLSKGSQIESEERDAEDEAGTTLWDPVEADTATTALWKPFKSWVMLMLVQLDAADALCAFSRQVELSNAQIDVKLVYSSLVADSTIPLEDLLTQTKYIPEAPIADPKTNAKILDFIKTANTLKKHVGRIGHFKKPWDARRASEAKSFIQEVLDETRKEHEEDNKQGNAGVDPNKIISELSHQIIELLSRPVQDADILAKFAALEDQLKERQAMYDLPFTEKPTFKGALHCEACLASILDKTTRESIQARIDTLKQASGKKKNEQLCHSLSQLLEDTKVGFFSVRLVYTVNPCSIHDRISRESSGYQNVAVQCAVVFLLIYRWMETPPPPALSRQVFTIPSRAAPYQNGPQNCWWMP
jgi:hypothetical protein